MNAIVPIARVSRLAAALLAIAALSALAPTTALAQTDTHAKVAVARASSTGTVTAIDIATRSVTVKNSKGEEHTFDVDPAVKGLENIKVGDQTRVEYNVAIAVALRKGGDGMRTQTEEQAASQASDGGKPAMAGGKRTTIVTNVISVDKAKSTVRLQGPHGHVSDFEVKDKAALADIKPGDQVVAVVYEELAIGVTPVAPK
jgi:Cu/Ag efflux protein CusF